MFDYEIDLDLHKPDSLLSVVEFNGKKKSFKTMEPNQNGDKPLFFPDNPLFIDYTIYDAATLGSNVPNGKT